MGQQNNDANKGNSINPYLVEWKKSIEAVDKFDTILVDLRKYGFSFLTGLITAGSLLGVAVDDQHVGDQFINIQIAVIILTMVLVISLYWLDIYYQNELTGAWVRSEFLGIYRLEVIRLSSYISSFNFGSRLGGILAFIYGAFLFGLLILGSLVLGFSGTNFNIFIKSPGIIFIISFGVAIGFKIVAWKKYDHKRYIKYKKIANEFFSTPVELSSTDEIEKCIYNFIRSSKSNPEDIDQCKNLM
jgi:hypothetical protein